MAPIIYNNYYHKKNIKSKEKLTSSQVFKDLNKNAFIVDTPGISFKVVNSMGFEIGHYLISNIVSFDIKENEIIIFSEDEVSIHYFFISNDDAEIANNKLNDIINGIFS